MDSKQHWEQIYAQAPAEEVSWYQAEPVVCLDLITAAGASPEAKIIDIGGGASVLVSRLLERGFKDITVLDISAAALQSAKIRLGNLAESVKWIEADITTVKLSAEFFDIWHDRAVFHFLTEAVQRQQYVERLNQALVSGGQIIISTFALAGPSRCSGLDVVRYSPESLQRAIGQNFVLVETSNEIHLTPWQSEQKFIYCRFKKVAN